MKLFTSNCYAQWIKCILRTVFVFSLAWILVSCGGGGGGGGSSPPSIDITPPITSAVPGSGTYGAAQSVTLTSNEPATIYYSINGVDPAVGATNTMSGQSPISGISIGVGTTVLKYFAIDLAQNTEAVKSQTYVVDLTSPIISLTGPAPSALGLLDSTNIGWQSSKAGSYAVELGGTSSPGTGVLISSGAVTASTPMSQSIAGTQLSYAGAIPLWIHVTDNLGHTGSTSVSLSLKPMMPIDVPNIGLGTISFLPNGLKAYVAQQLANTVAVIDTDPASLTFNSVQATISVGVRPHGTAPTPDSNRVYVTNGGDTVLDVDSVSVIATTTNTVAASILLGMNSAPNSIAITPDGKRAYFLRFEEVISSLDIDPLSPTYNTVTANIPIPGLLLGSIKITPDGSKAVVNWQGSGHAVNVLDVNPVNATYNTIVGSPVPVVSGFSADVAISSNSNYAYASDINNQLCRINLASLAVDLTGPVVTQSAFTLTPDGTNILIGNMNSANLGVIKASDLSLLVNVSMGTNLGTNGQIAISPDGDVPPFFSSTRL